MFCDTICITHSWNRWIEWNLTPDIYAACRSQASAERTRGKLSGAGSSFQRGNLESSAHVQYTAKRREKTFEMWLSGRQLFIVVVDCLCTFIVKHKKYNSHIHVHIISYFRSLSFHTHANFRTHYTNYALTFFDCDDVTGDPNNTGAVYSGCDVWNFWSWNSRKKNCV